MLFKITQTWELNWGSADIYMRFICFLFYCQISSIHMMI